MNRYILLFILGLSTVLLIVFGWTLRPAGAPSLPGNADSDLAKHATAVTQLLHQVEAANGDLATALRENEKQLPPNMRGTTLQGTEEIKDTLVQLGQRQALYEQEVRLALAARAKPDDSRNPVQIGVTLAGFLSTVTGMWFAWQSDRRDKRRLEIELAQVKGKHRPA